MNIFNTIYKGEYKATLRSLQFSLLVKLAGANADKFECFRPVISGLPTQQYEQERKAEFVELFIQMLLAGVNFDSLPTGCGCEDLVGNICNITGSGYAELIQGISDAPTQTIVTSCDAEFDNETRQYAFTIPDGATLIGVLLNGVLLDGSSNALSIATIQNNEQSYVATLNGTVDSGEATLCYTYSI
jgi:hypothetical protein